MAENYLAYKNLFMDFYATVSKGNLSPKELEALEILKTKWDECGPDKELDYFFSMKDQHTKLNFRFLEDEKWNNYTKEFSMWRAQMILVCATATGLADHLKNLKK